MPPSEPAPEPSVGPSPPIRIEWAQASDAGRDPSKQVNEDSAGYAETPRGHLFVVCDGMGGHTGGRQASDTATTTAQASREPIEAEPAKDEARAPQSAARRSEVASRAPETQAGLPIPYIAALLIAGCLCPPMVYSIVRARRRRHVQRNVAAPEPGAYEGAAAGYDSTIPAFLQRPGAATFPPGQGYEPGYEQACDQTCFCECRN